MIILRDEELEKKNTKNLLYIKRKLMHTVQAIGYCPDCGEHCGYADPPTSWEKEHEDYLMRIKKILATREHINRDKKKGKRA